MVMIEKYLTKEKSLVSAAIYPSQLHCPPFTISPWGRAGHIPKAASEGALSPVLPKDSVLLPLTSCFLCQPGCLALRDPC